MSNYTTKAFGGRFPDMEGNVRRFKSADILGIDAEDIIGGEQEDVPPEDLKHAEIVEKESSPHIFDKGSKVVSGISKSVDTGGICKNCRKGGEEFLSGDGYKFRVEFDIEVFISDLIGK